MKKIKKIKMELEEQSKLFASNKKILELKKKWFPAIFKSLNELYIFSATALVILLIIVS